MRWVRGFVAFLATVGWLAFVPAIMGATNPAPEQLITGFSNAPNPDAIFYAINKASAADSAPLRKAALAYIGDNDQKTRYAALLLLITFMVAWIMVDRFGSIEDMTPAVAILFCSLLFLFQGAGKISLDKYSATGNQ